MIPIDEEIRSKSDIIKWLIRNNPIARFFRPTMNDSELFDTMYYFYGGYHIRYDYKK